MFCGDNYQQQPQLPTCSGQMVIIQLSLGVCYGTDGNNTVEKRQAKSGGKLLTKNMNVFVGKESPLVPTLGP